MRFDFEAVPRPGNSPQIGQTVAKEAIPLGEMAARDTRTIEIQCSRFERSGCLSVHRLVARHGPDVSVRHVMEAEIAVSQSRDNAQMHNRRDPYSLTPVRPFGIAGRN